KELARIVFRQTLPLRVALAFRELQNLQGVSVGVFEIKSFDPACILVPIWQPLRPGRSVLDFMLAQPLIGALHIARDDGDVLEPAVVTARVCWQRATARR